ncbi:MAG: hypothetical protein ACOYO1_06145 [Bacteroidales bacterium]
MNEKQKIDQLFREALQDYREELPSDNSEGLIFRKLSNYKYLRLLRLSLGIIAIAIPITLFAYLLLNDKSDNNLSGKHNSNDSTVRIISNTLPNHQTIRLAERKPSDINKTIVYHESETKEKSFTSNDKPLLYIEQSENIANKIKTKSIETQLLATSSLSVSEENAAKESESKLTYTTELLKDQTPLVEKDILPVEKVMSSENKNVKLSIHQEANIIAPEAQKTNIITEQQNNDNYKKRIKIRSSFAIELSENLFFADKKLDATEEFTNLVKIRNESESGITAILPGIELRYNSKHFFVQMGLNLQLLGEKVNYNLMKTETEINSTLLHKDTLVYVYSIINPPEGQWQFDTIWFTRLDTTYKTLYRSVNHNNTYKYIEIPLLLGKSFAFSDFNIEVSTGISLGFLFKANAQILTSDNWTILSIDEKTSPYLNTITMNYLLRCAFRYAVSERWSVFARPELKYSLGSILNENQYPLKQKYMQYGIGLGFMYNF